MGGEAMIDEKILENVISKSNELKANIEKHGYTNLRFFFSGNEDDKNTLNIVCNFKGESYSVVTNEEIEKDLSTILGANVNFWGEGTYGLNKLHLEEAKNASLENMDNVIDYFIDVLIPYSTDREPDEVYRLNAKKNTSERSVFSRETNPNSSPMFFTQNSKETKDKNLGYEIEKFGESTFSKLLESNCNPEYQDIGKFLNGFMNSASQRGYDIKKILDTVNNPVRKIN